jgi:hypothetical protein
MLFILQKDQFFADITTGALLWQNILIGIVITNILK